jgi:hypothetical protein
MRDFSQECDEDHDTSEATVQRESMQILLLDGDLQP